MLKTGGERYTGLQTQTILINMPARRQPAARQLDREISLQEER
jgi:hypothetical protein